MADPDDATIVYRVAARRALLNADPSLIQLHFDAAVLDRYAENAAVSVIRTNTVGRASQRGSWSLDFGIAPDETTVHASTGDLLRLPDAEREHWAAHVVFLPSSRAFIQMRLAPGSCHDDGDVRPWRT